MRWRSGRAVATLTDAELLGKAPITHPLAVGALLEQAFAQRLDGLPRDTRDALPSRRQDRTQSTFARCARCRTSSLSLAGRKLPGTTRPMTPSIKQSTGAQHKLRQVAGNRADLLAEVAGILLGASEGRLDEPGARARPSCHRRGCRQEHDPAVDRGGTTPGRAPAASPLQPGRSYTTAALNASGRCETGGVLPGSRRPLVTPRRSRCAGHCGVPRPLRELITASACPSMAARASGSSPASSVKEIPRTVPGPQPAGDATRAGGET